MSGKSPLRSVLVGGAALWLLTAASAAATPPVGSEPPPIDLLDQQGKQVDLAALRGRVVLIDFWASWCGPCRKEMPVLESLHKRYGAAGLVIVGVNIDKSKKKMDGFVARRPVTFRLVHDEKLVVAARYKPNMMPSSYLISRDGRIRRVYEGFDPKDAAGIEADVKELLAESPN